MEDTFGGNLIEKGSASKEGNNTACKRDRSRMGNMGQTTMGNKVHLEVGSRGRMKLDNMDCISEGRMHHIITRNMGRKVRDSTNPKAEDNKEIVDSKMQMVNLHYMGEESNSRRTNRQRIGNLEALRGMQNRMTLHAKKGKQKGLSRSEFLPKKA